MTLRDMIFQNRYRMIPIASQRESDAIRTKRISIPSTAPRDHLTAFECSASQMRIGAMISQNANQATQIRKRALATHKATWIIAAILFLLTFCGQAQAQTAVTLALGPHPQFLDGTGKVLAGGFLYTYQAGTNTPEPTYADNLGTIQNPNPILLDATGAPSNNSGAQIQVWFLNASYKLCVQNSSLVQQWCSDNFSGYSILNNIQNVTLSPVTSDPSGTAGELGYRSDLGCFRGFSTFWDCLATRTGIETLSNKTLIAPIINNATGSTFTSPQITGLTLGGIVDASHNPTNFANFTNGAAGTTVNLLAKLVVSGSGVNAVNATTADTGGVEGVTIAGAGTSGLDLIQRTGQVNCTFDGSTTANDYVQISSTVNGNCHDTGSAVYPTVGGQILGRVLTTNVGAGNYLVDLFGPEIRTAGAATVVCTNVAPVTVTNNNAQQNLMSCSIPANALAQGSELSVDLQGVSSTASAMTITIGTSLGGGTACTTTSSTTGIANNQPWHANARLFVLTAGAGGTANWSCNYFSSASGGGVIGPFGIVGAPTISLNTTILNTLQITVQMSVANAGNSVVQQGLKSTIF